jgi:hypothetical protein
MLYSMAATSCADTGKRVELSKFFQGAYMMTNYVDAEALKAAIAGSAGLQPFMEADMRSETEAEFDAAKARLFSILTAQPPHIQQAVRSHLYRHMTLLVEDFQEVVSR